ncbi:hypothetical protein [Pseudorhodoplanes sp.]|uniref:hypothetical protein n=1 Tax=Pseudorhodoplanes sp. TaxID=1934341 RepID=UPI003D1046C0
MNIEVAEIAGRQIALEATVFALLARVASHADEPPAFLVDVMRNAEHNVREAAKASGEPLPDQAKYALAAFETFTASALILLMNLSPPQGQPG